MFALYFFVVVSQGLSQLRHDKKIQKASDREKEKQKQFTTYNKQTKNKQNNKLDRPAFIENWKCGTDALGV